MTDANPQPDITHSALIVDDNWYNRDIFRIALEGAGYTVTEAEDGQQGLDILEKQVFDLLILDLQMPKIDGRTVLKNIREQPKYDNMRIVVVTANPHMATDNVDVLADHVMHKPIDIVSFTHFTNRLKSAAASRKRRPGTPELNLQDIGVLERSNYTAMLPLLQVMPGFELIIRDDVIISCSETFPAPDTTHACLIKATPQTMNDLLAEIIGYFASKNLSATVFISPNCTPPDLAGELVRRGFVKHAHDESWVILDRLEDIHFRTEPSGIEIQRVGAQEIQVFAETFLAAFEQPKELAPQLVGVLKPTIGLSTIFHYLAKIEGQPAGTISLIVGDQYGIIGSTGVLPAHRKTGTSVELFRAIYQEAQRQRLTSLVAQTQIDSAAERILLSNNFRRAFVRQGYTLSK